MIKKGFTLIEMLVVISLIGILASLVLVSYTSTQKQARDTQRKSDLKQYQTALEQYANKNNGLYPAYPSGTNANGTLCTSYLALTSCPADPKDTPPYIYRYISDGTTGATATKYSFWTALENKPATYWVVCSSGKVGETSTVPTGGNICPL